MADTQPPHFGWINPSDEAGHFAFKIEGNRLSGEQWAECDQAAKFFARIRPFFLDYLLVDDYYGEVLRTPARIAAMLQKEPLLIQKAGLFHLKSHLICDKAVNGFVSAGGVFRDRLLSRLGAEKGSGHPILQTLSDIYDKSFEYRLFYGLRNFGQHNDAIINVIPISTDSEKETPSSVRLVLRTDRLRKEMTHPQAKLRADLQDAPEEIDFLSAATRYIECLREIFAAYLKLDQEDLSLAVGFAQAVRSGARGLPDGATPILLNSIPEVITKGEVTAGTVFDMKAMFLPLDEASLLEQLFPQLSSSQQAT
jgi:hypothetical protein